MAMAIKRLWEDDRLNAELGQCGLRRFNEFSWSATARHFRALYRLASGRPLAAVDRQIIATAPSI